MAEASFASLREAAYDLAGLRKYPWLGKTLMAPFAGTLLYRGKRLTGIPLAGGFAGESGGSAGFSGASDLR